MTPPAKLTLTRPTDAEINAAVAVTCDGWRRHDYVSCGGSPTYCWQKGDFQRAEPTHYLTDSNAVIKLLEKSGYDAVDVSREIENGQMKWVAHLYDWDLTDDEERTPPSKCPAHGIADTFNRAACFSLLKANGITIIE